MAKTGTSSPLTEGAVPAAQKPDPEVMRRFRPDGGQPGEAPMSRQRMDRGEGAGPFGSFNSEEAQKNREKLMNMTPEERKKAMEEMRKQGGFPGQRDGRGDRRGDRRGRRDRDGSGDGK